MSKNSVLCAIIVSLLAAFCFVSCEVGLGEAVDTQPPVVQINYPDKTQKSVIKDWFYLSGDCSDETGINSVSITFKKKNSNVTYGPFEADIDDEEDRWSYKANVPDENGSYPIADGTYNVTILAIDNGKRKQTDSIDITIDNTSPILIIQTPKTTTASSSATVFGTTLKFTGTALDENEIDNFEITVYDNSGNMLGKASTTDVSKSLEVTLGVFGEEDGFYNEIYSPDDGKIEQLNYKYTVKMSDSARKYQGDSSSRAAAEDSEGNTTTSYYLRADNDFNQNVIQKISTGIFRNEKGNKVTSVDALYYYKSGLYSVEPGSKADVDKYLEECLKNPAGDENPIGTFALKPKNNPYFTVSGLSIHDGTDHWGNFQKGSSEKLVISVIEGLSEEALDSDSFAVFLQPVNGTLEAGKLIPLENSSPIPLLYAVKNENHPECVDEAKGKKDRDDIITSGAGSDTITLSLDGNVAANCFYKIVVYGYDQQLSDIDNGNDVYAFKVAAAALAPKLKVTTPVDTTTYEQGNVDGTIDLAGTVTTQSGDTDFKIEAYFVTFTGSEEKETKINTEAAVEGAVSGVSAWSLKISKKDSNFSTTESSDYTIRIKASDNGGGDTAVRDITVRYDVESPKVEWNSVLPVLEYEEETVLKVIPPENEVEEPKKIIVKPNFGYVNGKITIKGSISDDLALPVLKDGACYGVLHVNNGDETAENAIKREIKKTIFSEEIDTKDLGADLHIYMTVTDRAGNSEKYEYKYVRSDKTEVNLIVEQETDIPYVKFNNATIELAEKDISSEANKNLFGLGSSTVYISGSDDDGIKEIVWNVDNKTGLTETKFHGKIDGGNSTNVTSSISLPLSSLTEGIHTLNISIEDKNGNKKVYGGTKFAYDNNVPSITTDFTNEFGGGEFTVALTASDTSGIQKIYALDAPENTSVAIDDLVASGKDGSAKATVTNTADGTYSQTFVAKDKYDREGSVTISYKVDKTDPDFDPTKITLNGTVNGVSTTIKLSEYDSDSQWFSNGNIRIDGNAGSIVETNPNALSISYGTGKSANPNIGTNNTFSATISFEDTVSDSFKIEVSDKALNTASCGPYTIRVDSTTPDVPSISLFSDAAGKTPLGAFVKEEKIYAKISASDTTSGIKKVEVYQDATYAAGKLLAVDVLSSSLKNYENDEKLLEIPLKTKNLAAGQYEFGVKVYDAAGNTNTTTAAKFTYDITPPAVTYLYPSDADTSADGVQVNKTISLSGTLSDTNLPISKDDFAAKLYVLETGKTDFAEVAGTFSVTGSNWTFSGIDTTKYSDGNAVFQLVVSDKAGNRDEIPAKTATASTITVDIKQDSDRPIITLNAINTDGSTTLSSGVIKGSVSDDDGLSGIEVYVKIVNVSKKEKFSDSGWGTKLDVDSNGVWETSVTDEANYELYVKVVDKNKEIFWTADKAEANQLYPKIVFDGGAAVSSVIKFSVDKNPPKIEKFMYAIFDTKEATTPKTGYDYKDLTNNTAFGGKDFKYAKFKIEISDDVITDASTLTAKFSIAEKDYEMSYNEGFFVTNDMIDFTTTTSGQYYAVAYAYDKSGSPRTWTVNVSIDNDPPTSISNINHPSTEELTGNVKLTGQVADDSKGNSGVKAVYYAIPTSSETESTVKWNNVNFSVTWEFEIPSSALVTGTEILSKYSSYQVGTTGIYNIPVWFKIVDKSGNVGYYKSYTMRYNPNADRPHVSIAYPSDYEILGGTIRFNGTAEDGNNEGISAVYLQFDMNGDGVFENGKDILEGFDGGVTIPLTSEKGILAKGTQNWSYSLDASSLVGLTYSETGKSLNVRAISIDNDPTAKLASAWSDVLHVSVNNAVPSYQSVELRKYASAAAAANSASVADSVVSYTSGDYISGSGWYVVGTVHSGAGFAKSSPIVAKREDGINILTDISIITLPNEATASFKDEAKTEKLYHDYEFRIPVEVASGTEWKLTVTAKDDSNKTSSVDYVLNIDNTPPEFYNNDRYTVAADISKYGTGKLYGGVYGSEMVVNSEGVRNTEGSFTLAGRVTEEGSGFKRLVFYFKRTGTANRVYNPMKHYGDDRIANRTDISYDIKDKTSGFKPASGDFFINSEKLPVLYLEGLTRNSDDLRVITLPSAQAANDNIRNCGVVKIGGAYRLIKTVSAGVVTLEEEVSSAYTSAEFVYGMVMDKNEGKLANDDGDGMIESYSKAGYNYTWDANFDSNNIPDGPIELCTVVFDAAGNSSFYTTKTKISNNAPRIARLKLATDLNYNNSFEESETETFYALEKDSGNGDATEGVEVWNLDTKKEMNSASYWTIKNGMQVTPEIVGGTAPYYWVFTPAAGVGEAKNKKDPVAGTASDSNKLATTKSSFVIPNSTFTSTYEDKANTYTISFWDSTEETTPCSTSQWTMINAQLAQDVTDTVAPKVVVQPFYWHKAGSGSAGAVNTTTVTKRHTYSEVKGNSAYSVLYDAAGNMLSGKIDDSAVVYSKETVPVNSLYETLASNGHVELPSDLEFTGSKFTQSSGVYDKDPKVSGKIVIRGTAYDDVSLSSLWFSVETGTTKKFTPAGYLTTAGYGTSGVKGNYYQAAVYNSGWSTASANVDDNGWAFDVEQVYFNQFGHKVLWTLTLDTSKVEGIALADVVVKVMAVDHLKNDDHTSTKTSTSASTVDSQGHAPSIRMDVVPYITKVTTALSSLSKKTPSMYDRTALGHYPVRVVGKDTTITSGETVKLSGFNLGSIEDLDVTTLSTSADSKTKATSCEYFVTVNGIKSLNNENNDNARGSYGTEISGASSYDEKKNYAYNRQPNNANNNLLTDDVYFDVWQFNSEAAIPISGKIEQPVMKIRPTDGKIGFAFVNGPLYFSMGGSENNADGPAHDKQDYSYQYWLGSYDFFTSVGFTYDKNGNSWGVAAGGDINSASADKFQLMTSLWGKAGTYQSGSYTKENSIRMESIGQKGDVDGNNSGTRNFDKQRIKSPSLATTVKSDGSSNLYMAYYDAMNSEIRFKSGSYAKPNIKWRAADGCILEEGEKCSHYEVVEIYGADQKNTGYKYGHFKGDHPSLINDAYVQICDENGNILSDTKYVIKEKGGSGDNNWFRLYTLDGQSVEPFPFGEGNYEVDPNDENYIKPKSAFYVKTSLSVDLYSNTTYDFGLFTDYDTAGDPYTYRNATVSMIATDKDSTANAGQYVSIAAIPGATNDTVVAVWYDETNRTMWYSYNSNPLGVGKGSKTRDSTWSTPVAVFEGEDFDSAGEYCKIAVDEKGGVHIAAYDPVNLDLVYACLPADKKGVASAASEFTTCVVDSNGVVGSNLTLDVALDSDGTTPLPYIGYYATSCIKPKIARLVADLSDGSFDDEVTGVWEISVVPTAQIVEMQSNQHNDINIGIWKDADGKVKASVTGSSSTSNTLNGYNSTSNGQVWGNGTMNAVLGYAVKKGSSGDTIETAQMK